MNSLHRHKIGVAGIIALVCLTAVGVYMPGLTGPFMFDDGINILSNKDIFLTSLGWENIFHAMFPKDVNIFQRPLAMLSFAINYYFAGGTVHTLPYKLTNLTIHLVNTVLVYGLCRALVMRLSPLPGRIPAHWHQWAPVMAALIWSLHPLHLTSVLYVVQRMTSLSATAVLAGLLVFIAGRNRLEERKPHGLILIVAGLIGGVGIGLGFKENAILLPVLMAAIELYFFGINQNTQHKKILIAFYSFVLGLPIVLLIGTLLFDPNTLLGAYKFRDFTVGERLLTEGRVLWFYISLFIFPDVRRFSLFHDDIPISSGLFEPWTTLPSTLGIVAALIFALSQRKRFPVLGFAIAWYFVGHSLESTFLPLEIAHEHRNYLPDVGLSLGIVYMCFQLFDPAKKRWLISLFFSSIVAILSYATHTYASVWRTEDSIVQSMVDNHPLSARAHAIHAEALSKNQHYIVEALNEYQRAQELAPLETSYLLRIVILTSTAKPRQTKNESLPKYAVWENQHSSFVLRPSEELLRNIDGRVGHQSISANTEETLIGLAHCILSPPNDCAYLYSRALGWYKQVLANQNVNDKIRHDMTILIAQLYLGSENYAAALDLVTEARHRDPRNSTFALMQANIYYLTGRYNDAESIAHAIRPPAFSVSRSVQNETEKLLTMIQERKAKITSPQKKGTAK